MGANGFPNGEAQKSNFPFPQYNHLAAVRTPGDRPRWPDRKGRGEYGQLSGEKDVTRRTVQVGKFAVHDVLDGNDYAEDARVDFLNWSIWTAGAFDYPADQLGLTWGVTAELDQERWAARFGYFLVGNQPNANMFDMNLFSRGGYVGELELRYQPFGKKGVAKFRSWLTGTFAGSYNDAVALAATIPGRHRQRHRRADLPGPHQVRLLSKPPAGNQRRARHVRPLQLERRPQQDRRLHRHRPEPVARPAAQGDGTGRPDDRIGLAGAWNTISPDHSRFSRRAASACWSVTGDLPARRRTWSRRSAPSR